MNHQFTIEAIKHKFEEVGSPATIPNLKSGKFIAELVEGGINVDNLSKQPFLPWKVFEVVTVLLLQLGGSAEKGDAMNNKLGEDVLRFESIEGRVASEVYGKKAGDSVFRRITPIACLLIWAGVCENKKGRLKLLDSIFKDEKIIRLHWNYFLALEEDLRTLSRYIEFNQLNFSTYSIQLAHLFLSACSEIDVVAKALCKEIIADSEAKTIIDYQNVIIKKYPNIMREKVSIPHYGISFIPWKEWENEKNSPKWWSAYNKVKHKRTDNYCKANLENLLNAMSALFLLIFYFRKAQIENLRPIGNLDPLDDLQPDPQLLKLDSMYYMLRSLS